MKTTILIILICLILGTISTLSIKKIIELNKEVKQQKENLKIQMDSGVTYKTDNGNLVLEFKTQKLELSQLKESYNKLLDKAKELGVKPNRISSIEQFNTSSNLSIKTNLKDTIEMIICKYNDSLNIVRTRVTEVKIKSFSYHNYYYNIYGKIVDSSIYLTTQHRDTITQLVVKYKENEFPIVRWFYGWKYKQLITNQDTTSKLSYPKLIEIRR